MSRDRSSEYAAAIKKGAPQALQVADRWHLGKKLTLIRQASPSAESAHRLVQTFMQMIREHTGQQLDTWLSSVEASHLPELESFAKGIHQDKMAVLAGLMLPWSNGPRDRPRVSTQAPETEHVWSCEVAKARGSVYSMLQQADLDPFFVVSWRAILLLLRKENPNE